LAFQGDLIFLFPMQPATVEPLEDTWASREKNLFSGPGGLLKSLN
jgi:hypothetical protein